MADPNHPIQEVHRHLSAAVLALADCDAVARWPADVDQWLAIARLLTEAQERLRAATLVGRASSARRAA